jgi:hypothetical protein
VLLTSGEARALASMLGGAARTVYGSAVRPGPSDDFPPHVLPVVRDFQTNRPDGARRPGPVGIPR